MGIESKSHPRRRKISLAGLVPLLLAGMSLVLALPQTGRAQTQPTQATTVPLMLPGGLAYDSAGDLFFAETARHVVRRVSPTGILSTVAGTGVQGFGGDGGPAVAALLDSPGAVALDGAGNLFIADSHNHRIRRVDAGSGGITTLAGTGQVGASANGTLAKNAQMDRPTAVAFDTAGSLFFADSGTHLVRRIDHATSILTTVAGNGVQGFSGDGGPALAAAIDTPSGLAVDGAGNLYLADTHNQRVRRVDAATGVITSVAGTGQSGFSGDGGAAGMAALRLPRGLALDAAGNLYLADASNHRVRRIDAATGQMTTVAGDGTQGYAGDSSAAVAASLDSPRTVALSPASLPTLSDTSNQRVRQVDAAAVIHTLAGLGGGTSAGGTSAGTLTLAAPNVVLYGTGTVQATLAASAATGSVTFFDTVANTTQTLGAMPLLGNAASFPTARLPAGNHRISATYSGDALHLAAPSGTLSLTISPAPVSAAPASFNILYGQPVPVLTGTLTGVLPQDAATVTLALSSPAAALSPAAVYPVSASLTGAAAGNYALTAEPASVTISKAPTLSTLSASMVVHVAPTTSGVAAGTVSLMDGASPYASATLSLTGDAAFSGTNLSLGTHTLTAVYPGNNNLLGSLSAPAIVTIGPTAAEDFTLAATGQTALTIPAGNAAAFSFAVNPLNGTLSSPIQLTVSGLPNGATASFNPAYLPPPTGPAAFILTIQTAKTAELAPLFPSKPLTYAALLPLLVWGVRKRRVRSLLAVALVAFGTGCGDRVNTVAENAAASRSYNITVIATGTSSAGSTLQHTAAITLTLQ